LCRPPQREWQGPGTQNDAVEFEQNPCHEPYTQLEQVYLELGIQGKFDEVVPRLAVLQPVEEKYEKVGDLFGEEGERLDGICDELQACCDSFCLDVEGLCLSVGENMRGAIGTHSLPLMPA
jgi:hypothetical protein